LEVARAGGATLFMVLQAGVAALLAKLGGGGENPIGTPIAGRGGGGLEGLVGVFVENPVLRTEVAGGPLFHEVIDRVRTYDLEAYAKQDVPFERVVEALQPTRSPARHPLFQVMLSLQNAPVTDVPLTGVVVTVEPPATVAARFDLMLNLNERVGSQ